MKKKIVLLVILIILIIVGVVGFYKLSKVDYIRVEIDNTKSENLRISMAPAYETIIYGTLDSKIKLDVKISPNKKINQTYEWILSNDCVQINEDNILVINKTCNFEIFAQKGSVKSNVLEFVIE